MNYLKRLLRLWPLFGLYVLLLLIVITTNPFNSPLPVVVIPFVLLFIALFATFNHIIKVLKFGKRLSAKKRLLMASLAAWLPVMLLILRSIDQLTGHDAIILAVFIAAFLLYITRIQFQARPRT